LQSRTFHVPSRFVRGALPNETASIESALWLIAHMCEHLSIDDLGETEVLDVGCGVKFTQALLSSSVPIKTYVGCDVDSELISFLKNVVDDPRFEYVHLDAHNARYNPRGKPLTEATALPIGARSFELICLFSVFTHLDPQDFSAMLKLLRRYARPDTRIFFTLYLDELTEGGHGLMDGWARMLANADAGVENEVAKQVESMSGNRDVRAFRDLDPSRPLLWAVYSEEYARDLIGNTGWTVLSLSPPDRYIQHHFVCAPC
jgi:SAM-dependent methyltransferase